jgi:hypothetical protein
MLDALAPRWICSHTAVRMTVVYSLHRVFYSVIGACPSSIFPLPVTSQWWNRQAVR